jgi:hypothetical protein
MPRVENAIESAVGRALRAWSTEIGVDIESRKLTVPGERGWPDRMILWEGGNVFFIEFKQPGAKPRALQTYIHEKLRALGFQVEVHDDRNIALDSIKEKVRASLRTNPGHEAHRR